MKIPFIFSNKNIFHSEAVSIHAKNSIKEFFSELMPFSSIQQQRAVTTRSFTKTDPYISK